MLPVGGCSRIIHRTQRRDACMHMYVYIYIYVYVEACQYLYMNIDSYWMVSAGITS